MSTSRSTGSSRSLWRRLRAFGLALLAPASLAAQAAGGKPNVLLICVDDLKPLLGCYGAPLIQTPHIDRLAARGVVFERAFANQAVCAPSRNALMTGLRPSSIGIYDLGTNFRLAVPDAVTVAQHFQQHGYRTEALGKIMHTGHGNREDAASWTVPHWRPRVEHYQLAQSRSSSTDSQGRGYTGASTECADVPDDAYADGLVANEAIRRLQAAQARPEEPWFLAVGFVKPHLPFVAPKKYWDLYDRTQFSLEEPSELPHGAPALAGTNSGELRRYSDIREVGPIDGEDARRLIHGYHAATSYMDAQLGRVLNELDRLGLAANTVIVLWGDHGFHLGDHGLWCKHTNYEQAARIPLIVVPPGGAMVPGRSGALVETVDLYPTLCELAGLPTPQGLDGNSFSATLQDPARAETNEAVFHVYPRGRLLGRAVRTKRYRLVEWKEIGAPAATAQIELYDYETDPKETRNLAEEHPEIVARLRAILSAQPEAKPQIKERQAGAG